MGKDKRDISQRKTHQPPTNVTGRSTSITAHKLKPQGTMSLGTAVPDIDRAPHQGVRERSRQCAVTSTRGTRLARARNRDYVDYELHGCLTPRIQTCTDAPAMATPASHTHTCVHTDTYIRKHTDTYKRKLETTQMPTHKGREEFWLPHGLDLHPAGKRNHSCSRTGRTLRISA